MLSFISTNTGHAYKMTSRFVRDVLNEKADRHNHRLNIMIVYYYSL